MKTAVIFLSAMSLGLVACALRDGNGDLVFPNLGKPSEAAAKPAATGEPPNEAPTETESEARPPAPMTNEIDPHPDAEEQRGETVKALDNFLAQNYLPGMGSHVEYRGHCVIHSDDKDLSLMHLNRKFLSNVEWLDPPVGKRFYKITIADDSRKLAVAVKVSSESAAQQVVEMVQALATTCGS
jgi:hypothetical protein